jgi:hypothetical protein
MGDDKASPSRPAGSDRELLMAGHSDDMEDPPKLVHSGREVRWILSPSLCLCSSALFSCSSTSSEDSSTLE